MKKLFGIAVLLLMMGCSNPENDKLDLKNAKENNPLLVPPCLENSAE